MRITLKFKKNKGFVILKEISSWYKWNYTQSRVANNTFLWSKAVFSRKFIEHNSFSVINGDI